MTWVTTEQFLKHFGLADRNDLPGIEELRAAGLLGPRPELTLAEAAGGLPDAGEDQADGDESPLDDEDRLEN